MAYTYVRAGQTVTADLLNDLALVGQFVFRATRDTVQALTTQANGNPVVGNAMSWETVDLDDLGGWSVANPTRYTVQRAGWYDLAGGVSFAPNTTGGIRSAGWFVNGSLAAAGHGDRGADSSVSEIIAISARTLTVELDVGDYVELAGGHDVGANLNTSTGGARPYASIAYARPSG